VRWLGGLLGYSPQKRAVDVIHAVERLDRGDRLGGIMGSMAPHRPGAAATPEPTGAPSAASAVRSSSLQEWARRALRKSYRMPRGDRHGPGAQRRWITSTSTVFAACIREHQAQRTGPTRQTLLEYRTASSPRQSRIDPVTLAANAAH